MKRFTKVCFWICGISLLLGILMMSVSWALGFKGYHPYTWHDWQLIERNEVIEEAITSLDFEVQAGSIVVEEGDSFSITAATSGNHFKSRVENGTWIIEEVESHEKGASMGGFYVDNEGVYLKAALGEVHVTVPRGYRLKNVDITVQAGAMEAEMLHCETMNIEVQAGSAAFTADVSRKISAQCQAGGINGSLKGKEEDFNLDVSCDVGNIVVGSYEYGGLVFGNEKFQTEGAKEMELSCDVGSIEFYFEE